MTTPRRWRPNNDNNENNDGQWNPDAGFDDGLWKPDKYDDGQWKPNNEGNDNWKPNDNDNNDGQWKPDNNDNGRWKPPSTTFKPPTFVKTSNVTEPLSGDYKVVCCKIFYLSFNF